MDNKLMKTKEDLLKGEMQGLVFTEEMKRNVLAEISQRPSMSRQKKKVKNKTVPAALSFAAVTAFAIGMYYIISNGLLEEPNADKPPEETEIITPIEEDVKENDNETEEETEEKLPDDTVEEEEEPDSDPDKEQTDTETDQEINDDQKQDEPVVVEPTKEELADIINNFTVEMEEIDKTVNSNYEFGFKYPDIETREEYYSYFTHLATLEVIDQCFSFRLEEKDDGLYMLPTNYPFHFSFENPYDIKKINDKKYQILQIQNNVMFSPDDFQLTFTFEKIKNRWIITNIDPIF
ncbi:hypothetical protein [Bacillus mesophilum]|uniref:Uncharacterized protein n=1 Tax=Bacillus mesophilum TaxID=1071718 RepID=A0A7V7RM46_9BACI|nr:hypothetical protein [Bacillus mesophilum]KAB2332996.1 hypothetical protein F7732_13060 [Bacillus mesophilum]